MDEFNNFNEDHDSIFTKSVKAGKRTYFIDVKKTKKEDFYLVISERTRKFNKDTGNFDVEKHRIYLYQEDFSKFIDGLNETIDFIEKQEK